jgi:predicted transposase/invertase (TIGR01784 family)
MFDSTCKFIAATYASDMAAWLLGKPIKLTELKPSELSLEPIRADSLIFLQSEEVVLHIEFQTDPDEDIPFRMLDYRLTCIIHERIKKKLESLMQSQT